MEKHRLEEVFLAPRGAESDQLAVLVQAGYGWPLMGVTGRRLVRIARRSRRGKLVKVRVKRVRRRRTTVATEDLLALKAAFMAYVAANEQYREEVQNPDFEAERVEAMSSPEGVTNCLIHHIRMSDERRMELLLCSDADRVRELQRILADTIQRPLVRRTSHCT